jgi:DNA invertase Pin-like site-specific DNA recombinase
MNFQNKIAAAYLRVSDERQDEFSPDSQLKLIKDYCSRNNIELPEEYIFYDDGISAKSVKKRKQFNDMIALAKQKDRPFNIILVWKFSRFARNQEESIVYKSLLRRNGVEVVSISEPIQDNPFGGLIERIIEWMDEYYLIRLSDEVRRGMTERATRGLPNVAPPYGYKMVDGEYEIIPEQAEVVKTIFEMYLQGNGHRTISDHLVQLGVKNKHGNPIDNRGVEYILNNPVYNGFLRWNPKGKSASARNYNNPDDIIVKGTHSPIIDDITFQRAKQITENRYASRNKYARERMHTSVFMLKGLVRCGECGSTLVLQKVHNGIQCHKYARGVCKVSHFISLSIINEMVLNELKNAVKDLSFKTFSPKKEKRTEISINFDAAISSEKNKLERAKIAYQSGVDSLAEYRATKTQIEERIAKLQEEKQKQHFAENGINVNQFADTVSDVIKILENPNASEELKNEVLKTIVDKIVLHKPDNRIEIFFYT